MRTGTSLIARQLHELGCPMGTQMRFPLMRENAQLDWEDVELTDKALAAVRGTLKKARLKVFFNQYIRRRSQDSEFWGVKSPFLLPYVDLFKAEAAALDKIVKVILTTRDVKETFKSIKRQTQLDEPIQIQKILMTYPEPKADLIIEIEESWNSPETVKQKLMELIRG
jgi:hypothetical protein